MSRDRLEASIVEAMTAASSVAMQWGRDDCALWCANILHNALGYDAAAPFRGRYRTRIGARRVLGKQGLAAALRASARRHKWRRIKPIDAAVGDVGLIANDDVTSTVVCRAAGWFVGRNETGFSAIPAADVRVAWSVLR